MGSASIAQPFNAEQLAAVFPDGFTARNNDADGTVEIECEALTDKQIAAALKTITYEPPPPLPAPIEDRLAAIEDAITKAADFGAMKAELAASDVSPVAVEAAAIEATPAPKK